MLSRYYLIKGVGGRLGLVNEVGVEDVELVALDDLGRRVVVIVVRLVVLVPLVPRVHAVEVFGLARPVLLIPPVHLRTCARTCQAPSHMSSAVSLAWGEAFDSLMQL